MKIKDDREGIQRSRLSVLVGGKDKFMSGWGGARKGISYAYWACEPDDAETVERWVRSRSDIRSIGRRAKPPQGTTHDHCHIYCVTPTHPALTAAIN